MRVELFDFELPPERIALRPARPRDAARMLLVEGGKPFADRAVRELPQVLRDGDVLVFNDTRVIPAQLEGRRGDAKIGATLHKRIDLRRWQAFIRNAKRLKPGDRVDFAAGVSAIAEERHANGSFTLAFGGDEPVEILLERAGTMPLPPYIASKRASDAQDREDYQTVFAREDGAVAAPTALASASYTVREARDADGVTIREYVLPNNVVFAVAWQGPVRPDMNALLGNYFHRAASAGAGKPRGTGPLIDRSDDFQIESVGRPGNFFGKAILPRLLPANVRAEDVR